MTHAIVPLRPSLEALRQEYVTLVAAGRATFWRLGDLAAEAVRHYGRAVLSTFAQDERCSTALIRQRVTVCVAFQGEARHPDVGPSLYRAAYQAAQRLGRSPTDVLDEALERDWTVRDLDALGKHERRRRAELSTTCDVCGVTWHGTAKAGETSAAWKGLPIPCPSCVAISLHDGAPPTFRSLGTLR